MKLAARSGDAGREMAPVDPGPAFSLLAAEFPRDVLRARNMVILKTSPGHAN